MTLQQGGVLLEGQRIDRAHEPQLPLQLAAPAGGAGPGRKGRAGCTPYRFGLTVEISSNGFGETLQPNPGLGALQLDPTDPLAGLGQLPLRGRPLAPQALDVLGASAGPPRPRAGGRGAGDRGPRRARCGGRRRVRPVVGWRPRRAAAGRDEPRLHRAPPHCDEAAPSTSSSRRVVSVSPFGEAGGPHLQVAARGPPAPRCAGPGAIGPPVRPRPVRPGRRPPASRTGEEGLQLEDSVSIALLARRQLDPLGGPDRLLAGGLGQLGLDALTGVGRGPLAGRVGLHRPGRPVKLGPGRTGRVRGRRARPCSAASRRAAASDRPLLGPPRRRRRSRRGCRRPAATARGRSDRPPG